jgi:hypothetical protein
MKIVLKQSFDGWDVSDAQITLVARPDRTNHVVGRNMV